MERHDRLYDRRFRARRQPRAAHQGAARKQDALPSDGLGQVRGYQVSAHGLIPILGIFPTIGIFRKSWENLGNLNA